MNLNYRYLLGSMGIVGSTHDLLVDETRGCCCYCDTLPLPGFLSNHCPNVWCSHRPRTSYEHPKLEVFAFEPCPGIVLKFLKEEINLCSELISFLDGVHDPLA